MARRTPPAPIPTSHGEMMRVVDMLSVPQKSAEERAAEDNLTRRMNTLAEDLRTRNLANGLALAQQAARRQGPLVDVFAELGRRYVHLLDEVGGRTVLTEAGPVRLAPTKPQRTAFRVIEGGQR